MTSGTPLRKTDVIPPAMRDIAREWQMSPGRVSGGHVFLSGLNGCPLEGPPPADAEAQMVVAFDKVAMVLAACDLGWPDVVDMTSFHVGLSHHGALFREVRARYVQAPFPAWTAIECAGFAIPGVIVELKVTAACP